ncbi:MAG: glycosyltransferase [Pleomorphochaeta sp.]
MKILITSDFYFPIISGVANVVYTLKKQLEKENHDVRILTFKKCKKSYYDEKEKIYFFKSLKFQFYKDSLSGINTHDYLMKDVYAWDPDVIHSQTEFFSMRYAKKVAKHNNCPIIHTWHTNFSAYSNNYIVGKKLFFLILNFILQKSLRYPVIKIIAPSSSTKKMIEMDYSIKTPIVEIPSGIDLNLYSTPLNETEKNELFKKYNFNKNCFRIITIARLASEKNIDQMLKYFSELKSTTNNLQYIIVGDGPERKNLEKITKSLKLENNVIFCGEIQPKEVHKFYKCANLFISGSSQETQGLTYFEALASNLPIVCKKNDVLTKILIEGKNGYIFDNENEFLLKMKAIINDSDLYNSLVKNAPLSVANYGDNLFIDKLVKIYKETINEYNNI